MNRTIVASGALLGTIAIILGAFGAHALKKLLSPDMILTFETGVKYQMYMAIFLLVLGATNMASESAKKLIFYLVLFGTILFSGSIYFLATDALNSFDFKVIGILTPIGGFLLISGWFWLFVDLLKKKS